MCATDADNTIVERTDKEKNIYDIAFAALENVGNIRQRNLSVYAEYKRNINIALYDFTEAIVLCLLLVVVELTSRRSKDVFSCYPIV